MITAERKKELKFIQITGVGDKLYRLTQGGQVYGYHRQGKFPNGDIRYAFWGKITGHKAKDD